MKYREAVYDAGLSIIAGSAAGASIHILSQQINSIVIMKIVGFVVITFAAAIALKDWSESDR